MEMTTIELALEDKMHAMYAHTVLGLTEMAKHRENPKAGVTEDSIWNQGYMLGQQAVIREVMRLLKPQVEAELGSYFKWRGDGTMEATDDEPELTSERIPVE